MNRKNIIITAGGVSEPIDNVRKITNSSSGKLGMIIANEILKENDIDTIYYICSKESFKPNNEKVKIIEIKQTLDLKKTVEYLLTTQNINYFIHTMAVADYMVDYVTNINQLALSIKENNMDNIAKTIKENKRRISDNKISSNEDNLIILLKKTPKIISTIKTISPKTFLVGFKLLDNVSEKHLIEVAIKLRDKNNCDLVVANDLENIRNGIHKAFIIDKNDQKIIANGKNDIAKKLIKKMF